MILFHKMKAPIVAPLHLERWIPIQDVRRLIWRHLRPLDIKVLHWVHNSKYAHQNVYQWPTHVRFKSPSDGFDAAKDGRLERIQWMIANEFRWNDSYTAVAITYGHLNVFEWAMQRGENISRNHATALFETAHWNILDERVYPLIGFVFGERDPNFYEIAAENGSLEGIHWLRSHGIPLDKRVIFIIATRAKQLHILEWMLSQGYSIKEEYQLCNIAARDDDILLIQWLRARGAPWGGVACVGRWSGTVVTNPVVLEWLYANGAPLPLVKLAARAVECRDGLRAIQWIYGILESDQVARVTHKVIRRAVKWDHLGILKWIYGLIPDHPLFLAPGLLLKTAVDYDRFDDLDILAWLRSIGAPLDDEEIMHSALNNGNRVAVRWLLGEGAAIYPEDEERVERKRPRW